MKKNMKKQKKDTSDSSGLFIPACLLIGIGIGIILDNVSAFTLIGLGLGFLCKWFFRKK